MATSLSTATEGFVQKEALEHRGETFKDVLYQIANHFIITVGRAFSSAAAYLGIISFLAPVEWFLAKVVIATSVAWWTWNQSKDYFIEKSPIYDPRVEKVKKHNEEQTVKNPYHKHSLDEVYFIGPKKRLNQLFKALSIIVFLAVCLTAVFPPLLPILGPAGVIASALGFGGAMSTMPYLAAGLATVTYISQSFIYAIARLGLFAYEQILKAFGKQPAYDQLSQEEINLVENNSTKGIENRLEQERKSEMTTLQTADGQVGIPKTSSDNPKDNPPAPSTSFGKPQDPGSVPLNQAAQENIDTALKPSM